VKASARVYGDEIDITPEEEQEKEEKGKDSSKP